MSPSMSPVLQAALIAGTVWSHLYVIIFGSEKVYPGKMPGQLNGGGGGNRTRVRK